MTNENNTPTYQVDTTIARYIDLEFFLNTYRSQHRGSYSEETLQYYLDYASIRIYNLKSNPLWDFNTSPQWAQLLVQYATAILAEHWLKQGNNLSLNDIQGSIGSISFSSNTNRIEYVPKVVLDLLIKAQFRESGTLDLLDSGYGDIDTYSPVFKTQQYLGDVSIEEATSSGELVLLTKDRTIELLKDATNGEFQFQTGEYLHNVSIEGNSYLLYSSDVIEGLLIPIDESIARLFQEKANASDVYTKGVIDSQQRDQDTRITNIGQKANSNTAQINGIKNVLESGGLTKEIFNSTTLVTLSTTPYRLNPTIKIPSNRVEMLTYSQEINYKKFIVKQNGLFEVDIIGTLQRVATNLFTISIELYDATTNALLDTQEQAFNLTNTSTLGNQVGKISYKVSDISPTNLERSFYVSIKLKETGATVQSPIGAIVGVSLLSDLGSGSIATSDDALNTSNVEGTTMTDAFNTLDSQIETLVTTTATIDFVNTSIEGLQTQVDEKVKSIVDSTSTDSTTTIYHEIQNIAFKHKINDGANWVENILSTTLARGGRWELVSNIYTVGSPFQLNVPLMPIEDADIAIKKYVDDLYYSTRRKMKGVK